MSIRLVTRSVWDNPGNRGRRLAKMIGAVLWQVRKRTILKPLRIRLASGAAFIAHPDCVVSSSLIYADWPEYAELQFIRSRLAPEDVVIDVGANVGHVGLLLADIVDSEAIIAFEPTPVTFCRLVANWEANGWPTGNLLQFAVGSESGAVLISELDHPDTKNAVMKNDGGQGRTVEVPLVTVDSCRNRWKERPVGFLKIDVEGFEEDVLAGARLTLEEDRPRVIMFESLAGHLEPRIAEILEEADYTPMQLDDDGRPVRKDLLDAQNLFALPGELARAENIV